MKDLILLCLFPLFLYTGNLSAQESQAKPIPDQLYARYMAEVKDLSVFYNGKEEVLSTMVSTNHPYLATDAFTPSILWYDQVEFKDVLMRYNLMRDELIVRKPDTYKGVILEKEKVNRVFLNGCWLVSSETLPWQNKPLGNYLVLLSEGDFPVIKKVGVVTKEEVNNFKVIISYDLRESFYICINNVCYPVKNKASVLRLFPDRKKELETYIKQQKLKFGNGREQSIVAIVAYYQSLIQ